MTENLSAKVENGIATITLNRPEMGNAFTDDMYFGIADLVDQYGADENVRAIIITGAGKNFCAGGDVARMKKMADAGEHLTFSGVMYTGVMAGAVKRCPKPVVAMINGAAAGAGLGLALACDFRVMSESGKLVTAFIGVGVSGDTGVAYFLNKMVGIAKTTELMMLNTPVSAQEALAMNLTTRVAEEGKLEETALELASKLAKQPTRALSEQKKMFYKVFFRDLDEFFMLEAQSMETCAITADHKEAVTAFVEKRKPVFTGK